MSEEFPDKTTWGDGPWNNEVDLVEWVDSETGYKCKIRRHERMGHLCGYVAIPKSHALYEHCYDGLDMDVHGGLTYANPSKDNNIWVFGFDCAHCYDYSPGMDALLKRLMKDPESLFTHTTYRDIDYVKSEVESLARQLKEKENEETNKKE